ncbi:MAG: hypothetical protein KGL39_43005 [Patescibacteria group bacterium]|nr:hypothetical protein [Patescibacteria group bacterium]
MTHTQWIVSVVGLLALPWFVVDRARDALLWYAFLAVVLFGFSAMTALVPHGPILLDAAGIVLLVVVGARIWRRR